MLLESISQIYTMLFIRFYLCCYILLLRWAYNIWMIVESIILEHLSQFYFQITFRSARELPISPQRLTCFELSFFWVEKIWLRQSCSSSFIQIEASSFFFQSGSAESPSLKTLFMLGCGLIKLTFPFYSLLFMIDYIYSSFGKSSYSCDCDQDWIETVSSVEGTSLSPIIFYLDCKIIPSPILFTEFLLLTVKPLRWAYRKKCYRFMLKVYSMIQFTIFQLLFVLSTKP